MTFWSYSSFCSFLCYGFFPPIVNAHVSNLLYLSGHIVDYTNSCSIVMCVEQEGLSNANIDALLAEEALLDSMKR